VTLGFVEGKSADFLDGRSGRGIEFGHRSFAHGALAGLPPANRRRSASVCARSRPSCSRAA